MFSYGGMPQHQRRFHQGQGPSFMYAIAAEECLAAMGTAGLAPASICVLGDFPLLDALKELYPGVSCDVHPGFAPETLLPESTYDLVISVGQLQWINDPVRYLGQVYQALTPNGMVYCVFPGESSLNQLHQALVKAEVELTGGASQRIHPMIGASDALNLFVNAGFKQPLAHTVSLELHHETLGELIADLRHMNHGVTLSSRPGTFAPKRLFQLAETSLRQNSMIHTGIDLIVLMGRK